MDKEMDWAIKNLDDKVMLHRWFSLQLRDKIINTVIRHYKKRSKRKIYCKDCKYFEKSKGMFKSYCIKKGSNTNNDCNIYKEVTW